MLKQYFKFDTNGFCLGSLLADYNSKNPKPSNVTSVVPANGLCVAKFDGTTWIEAGDPAQLVKSAILLKLEEINMKCSDVIFEGIDIETSVGVKHFSLTQVDQISLLGLASELEKAIAGAPSKVDLARGIPYHADGELCRFWTPSDFGNIAQTVTNFVLYNQTYCNHLREYIKGLTSVHDIQNVTYGMDLPENLQESLNNILGK